MRVWVARPEPAAARTAAALVARGHAALVAPVLAVRPTDRPPPEGPFDGIVVTSANAVPALRGEALRGLPVFAVGPRTAGTAAQAGLGPVIEGPGDGAGLAARVRRALRPGARLLLAAGAARKPEPAASLAAGGYALVTFLAYEAAPLPALPEAAAAALGRDPAAGHGDEPARETAAAGRVEAVLHYSRRSAATALALAEAAGRGGAFRRLRHYCLSGDAAAALEEAGVLVHFVAARPREADLLDGLGRPGA